VLYLQVLVLVYGVPLYKKVMIFCTKVIPVLFLFFVLVPFISFIFERRFDSKKNIMFSFCYPYNGGRVAAIIKEAQRNNSKTATLPSSSNDDKIKRFNESYKDHIDVQGAYDTFAIQWELQKQNAGENGLRLKRTVPLIGQALITSFSSDLWKAVIAKLVWGILLIFSIWFFVFSVLDFIKLKKKGIATKEDQDYSLIICILFFYTMFALSVAIQQMGHYSSDLGAKVKAALTTAIYKKMISREGHGSEADVVSLVAKDVEKLAEACLSW
jgi:hypothetical protein